MQVGIAHRRRSADDERADDQHDQEARADQALLEDHPHVGRVGRVGQLGLGRAGPVAERLLGHPVQRLILRAEAVLVVALLGLRALAEEAKRARCREQSERQRAADDEHRDRAQHRPNALPSPEVDEDDADEGHGEVAPGRAREREDDAARAGREQHEEAARGVAEQARAGDLLEQDRRGRHEERPEHVGVLEEPLSARVLVDHEAEARQVRLQREHRDHRRAGGREDVGLDHQPRQALALEHAREPDGREDQEDAHAREPERADRCLRVDHRDHRHHRETPERDLCARRDVQLRERPADAAERHQREQQDVVGRGLDPHDRQQRERADQHPGGAVGDEREQDERGHEDERHRRHDDRGHARKREREHAAERHGDDEPGAEEEPLRAHGAAELAADGCHR